MPADFGQVIPGPAFSAAVLVLQVGGIDFVEVQHAQFERLTQADVLHYSPAFGSAGKFSLLKSSSVKPFITVLRGGFEIGRNSCNSGAHDAVI